MSKSPVLIIGGHSDIGRAVAHRYARAGHPIQLAARFVERLDQDKRDLAIRYGVEVSLVELDILKSDQFDDFIAALPATPEIAICVVGLLGEQGRDQGSLDLEARILRTNFEGPAQLLGRLATLFERRGSGCLVGVSSVAGDRGRASNYIYGSAKAGFTAYLSGLRNRLAKKGVHVVTVLPGFVRTKMTDGMDLPEKLTATPKEVAIAIEKAVARKKDKIYVRPVWRVIMGIIKAIPEPTFKRLKI